MATVVHRLHHPLLGKVVASAGGFVQNQYQRVVVPSYGNADELALPTVETHTTLAPGGLVSLWQFISDELMWVSDFPSALDSDLIDVFKTLAELNILEFMQHLLKTAQPFAHQLFRNIVNVN